MNKLWIRLSLAIFLVTMIGLLIATLLANWRVNERFRRFVADNFVAESGVEAALSDYYRHHQSWVGVETVIASPRRPRGGMNELPPPHPRMPNLILTDLEGRIIYSNPPGKTPNLSWRDQARMLPIEVDGQTVGQLLVAPPNLAELSRTAQAFLTQVSSFFLQAGLIAGGLGLLLGLVIARGLTAPLAQLADAARSISQGKLNQQVAVSGPEEVAELAEAFNEMSSALEEGERLRRNLIADVAHELRTPLSVLQGNLRAILDDVYPLEKAEMARLYDQTRLLNRLVNDLHELAQAEAHQLPLNLQPTDLTQLSADVVENFVPLAEVEGVTLQTQLPTSPVTIEGDSVRLRQVLHNLLTNALRHTGAGQTITINLNIGDQIAQLDISDTGEGIAPEHLPHIFDRFYRADPARSRDRGGTGLGLAIARAIVEAHQGNITVSSEGIPGRGSTFTLTFPLPT